FVATPDFSTTAEAPAAGRAWAAHARTGHARQGGVSDRWAIYTRQGSPTYRSPNAMIACAPVSASSRRVLTNTNMLHAVCRLPGLESISDACYRALEAEGSRTRHAQNGEACPCMHVDTHTQNCLYGAVQAGGESA